MALNFKIFGENEAFSNSFFDTNLYGGLGGRIASGINEIPLVVQFAAALIILFVSHKLVRREGRENNKGSTTSDASFPCDRCNSDALARKREFLSREGEGYGYKGTAGGWIDDWRATEFPNLILPCHSDGNSSNFNTEREIYLDYAGSALPTKTQYGKLCCSDDILANPHSTGPAASRTLLGIQQAEKRILTHLDALPGRFSSIKHPLPFAFSSAQCHPGYDIVFTSGTTEALQIIAERFPWEQCQHCGRKSLFLYAQNSHSSVVGIRELAIDRGAQFLCRDLDSICNMTKQDFSNLETSEQPTFLDCTYCHGNKFPYLLAFPAECNFGGSCPKNLAETISVARESGWYTLLDIAKAASTGPVHLRDANPDFSCLSFYKLFGEPTGLGALLVNRASLPVLFEKTGERQPRHYLGGGSVDILLPNRDFSVPRSEPSHLASLANGSIHFRGILSLKHGFDELDRLGGMPRIQQHATSLARELNRRLQGLRHGNGRSAVVIYGGWKHPKASYVGPTIAFNVKRHDGSFVGYNEVSKLAGLVRPPIQFRTGCFCNPGACQKALDLTDEQAIENFEEAGHVCGDHIDLVQGKPTGAIRVSFGKDSLWEDLDAFVMFVEETFVNSLSQERTPATTKPKPSTVKISELYLFPIKSCSAMRVSRWQIGTTNGKLKYDRDFALVDASGTAMRLQTCPKMGMIVPSINLQAQNMTVSAPGRDDLILDLTNGNSHDHTGESIVKVCGNKCEGRLWGDLEVSEWFSSFLGVQCWLARYSKNGFQKPQHRTTESPPAYNPRTGFVNEQPLLLISENAVTVLNQVLEEQNQTRVGSRHFRPNVVVKSIGDEDACHIEDEWKTLKLEAKDSKLSLEVKGSCARCTMIDYDPTTGRRGRTLSALAKYRRRNGQIAFGIFLQATVGFVQNQEIWIHEGDDLICT